MTSIKQKIRNILGRAAAKVVFSDGKRHHSLIEAYLLARNWIWKNTLPNSGICISNRSRYAYPEVTGYYIPTLLDWGMRDLAEQYVGWLLSTQNPDGSWSDPKGQAPYVFDTGQILKGLLAFYRYKPSAKLQEAILAGCSWICSCQLFSGQIKTPNKGAWGDMVNEKVHLYVLPPLLEAARLFDVTEYKECSDAALSYYLKETDPFAFDQLAHFYAYVCEAFADLDHPELALKALEPMTQIIEAGKTSPAYINKPFACPTALFQLACAYYKVGKRELGDKLFAQGVAYQRRSGGFLGSVGPGADYFPNAEISWPVKYFMDALLLKIRISFDNDFVPIAPDYISDEDGRYLFIKDKIGTSRTIIDVGCGKGRFLRNLQKDFPDRAYTGVDISRSILEFVPANIEKVVGNLLCLPIYDKKFDLVLCIETIEHAIDLRQAIHELARLVAEGGRLLIVDKRLVRTGRMNLSPWEQWCDEISLKRMLEDLGFNVRVQVGIPYDGKDDDVFFGIEAIK